MRLLPAASLRFARAACRVLALAITLAAGPAAQPARVEAQSSPAWRASARVETYVDTDATTVVRPRASLDAPVAGRWRATGTYMADVVTSASIDVVTRASQAIHETRHEGSASVSHGDATNRLTTGAYTYGHEPDFQSHAGTVTHARSLDERRLGYLVLRAGLAHGRVGTVTDPDFERGVLTANLGASFARVVTEASVVRVALELSHVHGFQSSAYRTVRIGDWQAHRYDGTDPDAGAWVFVGVTQSARERHPGERFRARLAADWVQSLGGRVALAIQGAAYADSWRVLAAELGPELRFEPKARWLVRVGGRVYAQSAAWFFRRRYANTTDTQGYLTDDKELGPMRTYTAHVAAQIPMGVLRLDTRIEGNFYRYPEFTLLPHKEALVITVGVTYQR